MMQRPYSSVEYLNLVGKIKTLNPDVTIGCDLIVGFPGETDWDFEQSLQILESGYLDYGHIFSYSDRPGTIASDLPDKINPAIIKERNRMAREICERNRKRQMESQIGKTLAVISEYSPNSNTGYNAVSDNYIKVLLPQSAGGGREIIDFRPMKLVGEHLEGEVISK
jgi:threonylcarbamoyladenosine tRNA methylthiotransferase MtaB